MKRLARGRDLGKRGSSLRLLTNDRKCVATIVDFTFHTHELLELNVAGDRYIGIVRDETRV